MNKMVLLEKNGRNELESNCYKSINVNCNLLVSGLHQRWKWWLMVALNILFLISGQAAATLLGRFYYDKGGNSKWMSTLVQTAAFPILFLALFPYFITSKNVDNRPNTSTTSFTTLASIYLFLGLIVAADNLMYSYGLLYLPVSTYSLICASQLAFNAIFSSLLNSQKFTPLILNSVVLLTLSSALLAIGPGSEGTSTTKSKHIIGIFCTLGASATYSLLLSLMQLTFEKIIKRETFSVVLDMQIYTAFVASCVAILGLFVSGEWKTLHGEMNGFGAGKISYLIVLIGTAVSWQICSVGVVGLIFLVSSLFSNVISTLALPVVPVLAIVTFHDKMEGVKVIALLLAIWGSSSYVYQHYLDDSSNFETKREELSDIEAEEAC